MNKTPRTDAVVDPLIEAGRYSEDVEAVAEHAYILEQQLAAKEKELAELREKLQDPNTVHVNILHGQIKLTKAQAIHIAGLPADVEEQLAELRNEMVRKSDDRVRIEVLKKDYKDLLGTFWEQKREITELRRDRERLDWLDTKINIIDKGHGDYRFTAYPGHIRELCDLGIKQDADIDAAIRHSQTDGEGEG